MKFGAKTNSNVLTTMMMLSFSVKLGKPPSGYILLYIIYLVPHQFDSWQYIIFSSTIAHYLLQLRKTDPNVQWSFVILVYYHGSSNFVIICYCILVIRYLQITLYFISSSLNQDHPWKTEFFWSNCYALPTIIYSSA